MPNILVVFTGGTIGSSLNHKGNIAPENTKLLIRKYNEEIGEKHNFDVLEPFTVLSENMGVDHWNRLIDAINQVDESQYDGIIVTHGSDTVSYTAAMAGYLLRHKNCPIVFIASNYILEDRRSNGLENFKSAIDLICDNRIKRGVYVCYKQEENYVYLATRLCEADHFADEFESFNKRPLGKICEGKFSRENDLLNPNLDELNAKKEKLPTVELKSEVAIIKAYPDLDYDRFDITGLKAILNVGYHSATLCTSGDKTSFVNFAKRCEERGVDLYISSFKEGEKIYESLDSAVKLKNVYRLSNISVEAAYAKLIYAYSLGEKEIINQNLYFEKIK
ncbi:MAG: asparaginase [Clostridia bacterium]|nr:asparaginase [Clostridia bacterium]